MGIVRSDGLSPNWGWGCWGSGSLAVRNPSVRPPVPRTGTGEDWGCSGPQPAKLWGPEWRSDPARGLLEGPDQQLTGLVAWGGHRHPSGVADAHRIALCQVVAVQARGPGGHEDMEQPGIGQVDLVAQVHDVQAGSRPDADEGVRTHAGGEGGELVGSGRGRRRGVRRRAARRAGSHPRLHEPSRAGLGRDGLRVHDAGAGRHPLHAPRCDDAAGPRGVLVRQLTGDHPGHDLEVAVGVVGIAVPRLHVVVVVRHQTTERGVGGVVVVAEREGVKRRSALSDGVEPVGGTADVEGHGVHRAPSGASECSDDPRALLDGSFRIQLGRHIGAPDQVGGPSLGQLVVQPSHRLLAGAEHHVIDGQNARAARPVGPADADVKALVVEPVVGDAGDHRDPGVLQDGAVRPAGRLAETAADGRGLALKQCHLARRGPRLLLGETARVEGGVAHAPVLHPVLERVARVVGQEVADVDADPAGADHRHPLADRDPPAQHVGIAHHPRIIAAGELGEARHHPGRDDHLVVRREIVARARVSRRTSTPSTSSRRV